MFNWSYRVVMWTTGLRDGGEETAGMVGSCRAASEKSQKALTSCGGAEAGAGTVWSQSGQGRYNQVL